MKKFARIRRMVKLLAGWFDDGKKIAEGSVAVVLFIGFLAGGWYWLDGRWDQRAIAGEAQAIRGQMNYQTNELKLGQARQGLEAWQQRWLEFQIKTPSERNSMTGQQYMQVINDRIEQYKKEVNFYERALQRDAQKPIGGTPDGKANASERTR